MSSNDYRDECATNESGYAVYPCVSNPSQWREWLVEQMLQSPEYKDGVLPFVLGGFGALAHPTSFHNEVVRDLRYMAYEVFFNRVFACFDDTYQMEAIIDRLMIRPNYRRPTAEKWHRDEAVGIAPGDIVYGGWINLDDTPQYFSCHPGSHSVSSEGGFKPATEAEKQAAMRNKKIVTIPPGHLLVFNETLVHEVVSAYRDETSFRLFTGFRISKKTSDQPKCLHDRAHPDMSLEEKIRKGAVIPLKSGQMPRMYPALTWSNKSIFKELTEASRDSRKTFRNASLTDVMNPKWLETKFRKPPGSDTPKRDMLMAPEVCASLASMSEYPPEYRAADLDILYPHSDFIDTHYYLLH